MEFPDLDDYNLMNASEKIEAEKKAGVYKDFYFKDYYSKLLMLEQGYETDWLLVTVAGIAAGLRNTG